MYRALADLVVWLHLAFIAFVVIGGWLALRWPRIACLHLPAAIWGALVEVSGWYCPLTPLENRLRAAAGEPPYSGDFVERYLLPVIYPASLTREVQIGIGVAVVAINLVAYWMVVRAWRGRAATRPPEGR